MELSGAEVLKRVEGTQNLGFWLFLCIFCCSVCSSFCELLLLDIFVWEAFRWCFLGFLWELSKISLRTSSAFGQC